MRKMLLTPLIVCMVALLSTLWMPAVHATTPIPVSGIWSWTASDFSWKYADGNEFLSAVEHDTLTGTFLGNGEGPFTMVIHPEGFITGRGRTLWTVTVQEKSGTLVIQWAGKTKWNDAEGAWWWWFMWVILSGTGELANLHGQGTCWGPGPPGVEMSGQIHFAPD